MSEVTYVVNSKCTLCGQELEPGLYSTEIDSVEIHPDKSVTIYIDVIGICKEGH